MTSQRTLFLSILREMLEQKYTTQDILTFLTKCKLLGEENVS